jgi:hypothetical protein
VEYEQPSVLSREISLFARRYRVFLLFSRGLMPPMIDDENTRVASCLRLRMVLAAIESYACPPVASTRQVRYTAMIETEIILVISRWIYFRVDRRGAHSTQMRKVGGTERRGSML